MVLSAPPRRPLGRISHHSGAEPVPALSAAGSRHSALPQPASIHARFPWLRCLAAVAALLGLALPAHASLGGNVNSVESDRAHMNARVTFTPHDSYNVHEIQIPGGTVVDEYVSPAGTVFAVSWRGQFPPPMQQILGQYFQQYSAALQEQAAPGQPRVYGHRPLNIQQPGLVVQTGGRMRAHFGRAWVPGLLPQGFAITQIQ